MILNILKYLLALGTGNMNKIIISRINYALNSTLGYIKHKDFFCFTLEPAEYKLVTSDDLGDGVTISKIVPVESKYKGCIPCGTYPIVWEWSPKFKCNLWELKNVPERREIKFHAGNEVTDTEGCVLVGFAFNTTRSYLGISIAALHHFNQLCHDEKIRHIEVRDV